MLRALSWVMISHMSRPIDISDLPQPLIEAIETIVRSYRERAAEAQNGQRPIGWARDYLPELPPSFFDSLPTELLDLFEGKPA